MTDAAAELNDRRLAGHGTRPAPAVLAGAAIDALAGALLPVSRLTPVLRLHAPPFSYWIWLASVTAVYALAAGPVERRYLRRHPNWL